MKDKIKELLTSFRRKFGIGIDETKIKETEHEVVNKGFREERILDTLWRIECDIIKVKDIYRYYEYDFYTNEKLELLDEKIFPHIGYRGRFTARMVGFSDYEVGWVDYRFPNTSIDNQKTKVYIAEPIKSKTGAVNSLTHTKEFDFSNVKKHHLKIDLPVEDPKIFFYQHEYDRLLEDIRLSCYQRKNEIEIVKKEGV